MSDITGGRELDRSELISDGIYEEINFKMVFLVKDQRIYRLLWNHVNEPGIISRGIYSTDKYIVTRNDPDIFTLKNGFLFKKINTNKETVNARVKELYHENLKYLNRKFYKRSPSEYTEPLSKTDDSLVVSTVGSPDVPLGDLTSDINRNSEEYERLINRLSEQQTLISKLQQQSDAYRTAGLEIIEKFRGGHAASAQEMSELKEIQHKLETGEAELRQHLQLYDEKLKEANSENEQLHNLMKIDSEINKLQRDHAFKQGEARARSEAQAHSGAQARARSGARPRLTRVPGEDDRNEELERRRRQLALLARNNKSLVMENQVLQKRLTSVIELLGKSGDGDITIEISRIREQLREDHEASIERMRQENEIIRLKIKGQLDHCNRRLQGIESENLQLRQDIEQQDQRCQEALAREGRQCDAKMGAQTQHYQQLQQQLQEQYQQHLQQLQQQLEQQGQQGPPASTFSHLHTPLGGHHHGSTSVPPRLQYDSSMGSHSIPHGSIAQSVSMIPSDVVVHSIPSQVAPGKSGLDKPVIVKCK